VQTHVAVRARCSAFRWSCQVGPQHGSARCLTLRTLDATVRVYGTSRCLVSCCHEQKGGKSREESRLAMRPRERSSPYGWCAGSGVCRSQLASGTFPAPYGPLRCEPATLQLLFLSHFPIQADVTPVGHLGVQLNVALTNTLVKKNRILRRTLTSKWSVPSSIYAMECVPISKWGGASRSYIPTVASGSFHPWFRALLTPGANGGFGKIRSQGHSRIRCCGEIACSFRVKRCLRARRCGAQAKVIFSMSRYTSSGEPARRHEVPQRDPDRAVGSGEI